MPKFKMHPNLITDARIEYVKGRRQKQKEYLYDGTWMEVKDLIKHTGITADTEELKRGVLRNRFNNHPFDAKYLLCHHPPAGLNFAGTDKYANRRKPKSIILGKPQWGKYRGKLSKDKFEESDRLDINQISTGSWEESNLI
jgi:hypothetical protein